MAGLAAFLSVMPAFSLALSIGVTPFSADLGLVEKGKSYAVEFFILTDTNDDIILDTKYRPVDSDFIGRGRTSPRYDFVPWKSSEQDMSGWIEILEKVSLVPGQRQNFISGSQQFNANKRVSFIIHVPDDAEPGYHAGYISFDPRNRRFSFGGNVGIVTSVDFIFVFRVAGEAERSGHIVGISQGQGSSVNVLFKNNGTVTIGVQNAPLKFSREGEPDRFSQSNGAFIRPGEITPIPMFFDPSSIQAGEYDIEAASSWTTGVSQHSRKFYISSFTLPAGQAAAEPFRQPNYTFLLLAGAFLLLLAYYWRRRK